MKTVYTFGFLIVIVLFGFVKESKSQNTDLINPELLERVWDAYWIVHPEASPVEYGVFHFRRDFHLQSVSESFVIHVSGDTRYRLFVNGHSVSKGPAVGDKLNWRYETVDIASYLEPGENVIAATVWNFAEYNGDAHMSYRTAFLLQGNTEKESVINTGEEWKVFRNRGYSPIPVRRQDVIGGYIAPQGERLDVKYYPHGWKERGYDDSSWTGVRTYFQAQPRGTRDHFGVIHGWALIPRSIPMMDEWELRIPELRRTEQIRVDTSFLKGEEPLVVEPESRAVLLLDQTYISNAYPVLQISGGRDAEIRLIYAESLRHQDNSKGHRDEIEGKVIKGFHDAFIADGGKERTLSPLWLRSFRYIQVEIETAGEPLTIHDFYTIATAYPFEENGQFNSSDEELARIWDVGWRTARLNAFESYWDCAYYEQLQYVGDTRIQALISLYVSGDDRLMRNAIEHFEASRKPGGITTGPYPIRKAQYIPPYSLLWVAMVHDYWMHRDDGEFVKQFLPGIYSVLNWFDGYLDEETGLLEPLPWWNYVDAARGFSNGVPPGGVEGNSIVISLQMLYAAQYAEELAREFGRLHEAEWYSDMVRKLSDAIVKQGWNEERQLIADTPEQIHYSQHANILAILTGLISEEKQADLVRRILEEEDLVQTTYYFRFYLFRAMNVSGLGNKYLTELGPWHDALAIGLTTFPEHPEPTRSDAHAWSASPNYDFLATVAGVRPDSPGFKTVLIKPHPGNLDWVDAVVPHPNGDIRVVFNLEGDGLSGTVELPDGLDGRFVWNGYEQALHPGKQTISM